LIPGGQDRKSERGADVVPDAVVIASDDSKYVFARRKVVVESLCARTSILPIIVYAA
jgi:hypothetical protein